MRKEGIFDTSNLSKWSIEDIGNNLKKAGYDRGGVNYILAERLSTLGKQISLQGQNEFEKALANTDKKVLKDMLKSLTALLICFSTSRIKTSVFKIYFLIYY